jgi:hypothetical protein
MAFLVAPGLSGMQLLRVSSIGGATLTAGNRPQTDVTAFGPRRAVLRLVWRYLTRRVAMARRRSVSAPAFSASRFRRRSTATSGFMIDTSEPLAELEGLMLPPAAEETVERLLVVERRRVDDDLSGDSGAQRCCY